MERFIFLFCLYFCLVYDCEAKLIVQNNKVNTIRKTYEYPNKHRNKIIFENGVTSDKDNINAVLIKSNATVKEKDFGEILSFFNISLTEKQERLFLNFLNVLGCNGCKWIMSIIKYLGQNKDVQDYIAEKLLDLCIIFKIEAPVVCRRIIPTYKEEFFYVVTQLVLSPTEVCGLLLGPKCAKFYDPFGKWTIKIPPGKPKTKEVKSKEKSFVAPLRVLQLTDLHHDPYYTEGSNAFCDEPLCCRASNGFPNDLNHKAGKWGSYQKCDLPMRTLENMLDHINKSHKIDYIFWTGDFPPHDIWNQTRRTQLESVQLITDLLVHYFPKIPVFPALGNHESNPVDSFPPPYVTGVNSIQWLYEKLNSTWTIWLDKNKVSSTIIKGAYYSTRPKPGYRIISLNMNYCNNLNWWLLTNMTDPAGELAWLIEQLLEAEKLNEKVHIIGHIPPPGCPKFWSYNYNNIINRFENTIQGTFFGHTHFDQLHLHYEGEGVRDKRATVAIYVAPSGTTFPSLNPAYRIYDVEKSSWSVLNHDNYFLNITDANLNDKPQWSHEYNAKEAYGMSSLSPKDWDKVIEGFKTNATAFNKYYRYKFHLSDVTSPCDDSCRNTTICDIETAANGNHRFC